MEARGSVFKYGDNIDTDVIIPARYLNTQNARELADHCMEDIDKTFITRVQAGDIMVGGENFGCGSSREHAPLAIKTAGIACVIAASFARIFYRNAINIGLPILECPSASTAIREGNTVSVNFDTGVITDETTGETFQAEPFPPFIQKIIRSGGLIPCPSRNWTSACKATACCWGPSAAPSGRACPVTSGRKRASCGSGPAWGFTPTTALPKSGPSWRTPRP